MLWNKLCNERCPYCQLPEESLNFCLRHIKRQISQESSERRFSRHSWQINVSTAGRAWCGRQDGAVDGRLAHAIGSAVIYQMTSWERYQSARTGTAGWLWLWAYQPLQQSDANVTRVLIISILMFGQSSVVDHLLHSHCVYKCNYAHLCQESRLPSCKVTRTSTIPSPSVSCLSISSAQLTGLFARM